MVFLLYSISWSHRDGNALLAFVSRVHGPNLRGVPGQQIPRRAAADGGRARLGRVEAADPSAGAGWGVALPQGLVSHKIIAASKEKRKSFVPKNVFPGGRTSRGCLGLRTCCWRCSRACASPGTRGGTATTARSCCDQWNSSPRGGRA